MIVSAVFFTTATALSQATAEAPAPTQSVTAALDKAMKHAQIAPKADKMKLYLSSCSISKDRTSYSFTFYDGGDLLHTVSINSSGKEYYSSRDKGKTRLFGELDFSKLPSPKEVMIEGVVEKSKKALNALEFSPSTEKLYISYNLRNHYKNIDQAHHYWNISMLTGDGTSGKTVGFENGKLSTVSNSTIKK